MDERIFHKSQTWVYTWNRHANGVNSHRCSMDKNISTNADGIAVQQVQDVPAEEMESPL